MKEANPFTLSSIRSRENQFSPVTIVFSKDRALQLDATLRSYFLHCLDAESSQIRILYTASSPLHNSQYGQLRQEYAKYTFLSFVSERDFRSDVISLLAPYNHVIFLVDDNIFIRDFSIPKLVTLLQNNQDALGFSLRLGKNTTYCYPLNKKQRLPEFLAIDKGTLKYNWTNADHDFGYPLEVSSSLYRTEDILPFISRLPFKNPNTLEGIMAENRSFFQKDKPFLLCNEKSVTFCAPLNKVQSIAIGNRASNKEDYNVENLAELFNAGYRIDVAYYKDFLPNACHREIELKLIKLGKTDKDTNNINLQGRDKRVNLQDVTFTIPVRYDSVDRIRNMVTTLAYLTGNLNSDIIITEEDTSQKIYPYIAKFLNNNVTYNFIKTESELFHRTKLLNIMAKLSKTFCIVNYDADIILPLNQYTEAFHRIKNNELDLCTPFAYYTLHVPKSLHKRIEKEKNIDWLKADQVYCPNNKEVAKGGVVFWNKHKFMECGMENEFFIAYGPEDQERVIRAEKLGYRWGRVDGVLLHLEHCRTPNSWVTHSYFDRNNIEFEKIKHMTQPQLKEYIKKWEWVQC